MCACVWCVYSVYEDSGHAITYVWGLEASHGCKSLTATLYEAGCLITMHVRLAGLQASKSSPVNTSHVSLLEQYNCRLAPPHLALYLHICKCGLLSISPAHAFTFPVYLMQ